MRRASYYTILTKGNLVHHLAKLEDAGLVTIDKAFVREQPVTTVALTQRAGSGRTALPPAGAPRWRLTPTRCESHPKTSRPSRAVSYRCST